MDVMPIQSDKDDNIQHHKCWRKLIEYGDEDNGSDECGSGHIVRDEVRS